MPPQATRSSACLGGFSSLPRPRKLLSYVLRCCSLRLLRSGQEEEEEQEAGIVTGSADLAYLFAYSNPDVASLECTPMDLAPLPSNVKCFSQRAVVAE